MLKGQIACAQKVSIYGQKQNKEEKKKKEKKKKKKKRKKKLKQNNNHITGKLPASLQFV